MTFLIDELQLPSCLAISGDVHYGMNLQVAFSWKGQGLPITQLVSSAQKHAGVLSKTALNLLGKIVPTTHERIGWDLPPRSTRSNAITRLMLQPVNTNAWSEDALSSLRLAERGSSGFRICPSTASTDSICRLRGRAC